MQNAWERNLNAYEIVVGKPEGRGHSEHLNVHGRIILKLVLEK
jgi:hypothetical protein